MIVLRKTGSYEVIETSHGTKLLKLDETPYVWIESLSLGSMLTHTQHTHRTRNVLATGKYRLYSVENEPDLVDEPHLELQLTPTRWQGYLLPVDLPSSLHARRRIIPTQEVISQQAHQPEVAKTIKQRQ